MFLANDASRNPHPDIASFASLGKAIGSQSSVNPWYNGMSRMTRMSKCLGAGNDRNRMSRPSKGIGGGQKYKADDRHYRMGNLRKNTGCFRISVRKTFFAQNYEKEK